MRVFGGTTWNTDGAERTTIAAVEKQAKEQLLKKSGEPFFCPVGPGALTPLPPLRAQHSAADPFPSIKADGGRWPQMTLMSSSYATSRCGGSLCLLPLGLKIRAPVDVCHRF